MLMNGHEEHTGLIFNRKLNEEMLCVEEGVPFSLVDDDDGSRIVKKEDFQGEGARARERERESSDPLE